MVVVVVVIEIFCLLIEMMLMDVLILVVLLIVRCVMRVSRAKPANGCACGVPQRLDRIVGAWIQVELRKRRTRFELGYIEAGE